MRSYEEFGIAAVLPGLVRAAEVLQEEIRELQARLNHRPVGRPKGSGKGSGTKSYWAKMTPEERVAEIKRRARVAVRNRKLKAKEAGA